MTKSAAASPSAAPQTQTGKAKPKATEQPLDLAKLGRIVADASKESDAARPRPAASQTEALNHLPKTDLGIRLGAERSVAPVSVPGNRSTWGFAASPAASPAAFAPDANGQAQTRTYAEDGVVYRETVTQQGDQTTTVLTYEDEGTSITETTIENDDTTTEVVEAERDGVVERTESVTSQVDEAPEGFPSVTVDGEAGPITQTQVTQTVRDTNQTPPTTQTTLESTSYQQQVRVDDDAFYQGSIIELDSGGESLTVLPDGEVEVHGDESGEFLSYTTTTVYDENGQPQVTESSKVEQRLVGTGENGQEVYASFGRETFYRDGEEQETVVVREERGTVPTDDPSVGPLLGLDEFKEKVEGFDSDYVDWRTTTVLHPDGSREVVDEFGDYREPHEDGETITVYRTDQDNSPPTYTYSRVSNDGNSIDSQTVVPGTEISTITQADFNDDGTYQASTVTTDGGEVISSQTVERTLVDPEELAADLDPEAREKFLAEVGDEPIYQDHAVVESTEGENAGSSEILAYSTAAEDGPQLSLVDQDGEVTTTLDNPQTGEGRVVSANGDVLAIDAQGQVSGTVNGQPFEGLVDEDGSPVDLADVQAGRSGTSALKRLYDAAYKAEGLGVRLPGGGGVRPLPAGLGRGLNGLGSVFGLYNVGSALANGDGGEALRAVAGAATSYAGTASDLGGAAAAKLIRRGGAVLSFGLAGYDLSQGRYLDAGLGAAAGVGLLLTAASGPVAPVVGLVVLGVVGLVELGRVIFSGDDPNEHVPLEI